MKCKSCRKQIEDDNIMQIGLSYIHKICYDNFIRETLEKNRLKKQLAKDSLIETQKEISKASAKKTAWDNFSKFIRARDSVNGKCECISCGRSVKAFGGKFGAQAGHFIPKSAGEVFRFNEDNVHAQCQQCNEHGSHDTGANYRKRLIKKIGKKRVLKLESLKHTMLGKKASVEDYVEIRERYLKKYKELDF